MYCQTISPKKESSTVSSDWNKTYKLLACSLERTACLFQQQGAKKKIGNKGVSDLYLKNFLFENK